MKQINDRFAKFYKARYRLKQRQRFVSFLVTFFSLTLIGFGLTGFFVGANDIISNLSAEAIGIAITVLVLDRIYQYRDQLFKKEKIISQMASPSNEFALDAVRIAYDEGWLGDGSLRGANLSVANLDGALLWGANLEEARFAATTLREANLRECNLRKCVFLKADCTGAIFQEADLSDADLREANMEKTNFRKAILRNCNLAHVSFRQADLRGADLRGCKMDGTSLEDALIDEYTRWDVGLNPKQHGVILSEK